MVVVGGVDGSQSSAESAVVAADSATTVESTFIRV